MRMGETNVIHPNAFGATLRAYRLGYAISDRMKAYVRLGDNGDGTINITIVPLYRKVPSHGRNAMHFQWWSRERGVDAESIFDTIPALKNVRRVKVQMSFDVDRETGERIYEQNS